MPVLRFAPDSDDRAGSASPRLPLRNVFLERVTPAGLNRYEVWGRPGLELLQGDGDPGDQYVRGIIPLSDIGGAGHLAVLDFTTALGLSTRGGPRVALGNIEAFLLNRGVITAYRADDTAPEGFVDECVKNPDPDAFFVDDFCHINQRLVAVERDSGRFWWTEPRKEVPSRLLDGDGNVDPTAKVFGGDDGLGFAEAQYSGDDTIGIEDQGNEIYLLGRSSIEIWSNIPDADRPFILEPGNVFDIGLLGTGAKTGLAGSFIFASARNVKRHPMRRVMVMAARQMEPVSSVDVELDLEALDEAQAEGLQMFPFGHRGRTFVAMQAHGLWTWVLDIQNRQWTKFNTHERPDWNIGSTAMSLEGTLVGSTTGPNTFLLKQGVADHDGPIEKVVSAAMPPQRQRIGLDRIAIDMSVPDDEVTLSLALSFDDGKTFEEPFVETLPADADDVGEPIWTGLGTIPPQGITFQVSWTGLEPRSLGALYVNEAALGG